MTYIENELPLNYNEVIQETKRPFKLYNDLLKLPNDVYNKNYIHKELYNWGNNIYNPIKIGGMNEELHEELLLLLDPELHKSKPLDEPKLYSENEELHEELLLLLDLELYSENKEEKSQIIISEYDNIYESLQEYYETKREEIDNLFSKTSPA
jgi:hypothetical protein